MDPSVLPHTPGEVRTTCATRFGAKHSMTSEGVYRLVESVFVPYGDIVFACFQTSKVFELSPRGGYVDYGQAQVQVDTPKQRIPGGTFSRPDSPLRTPVAQISSMYPPPSSSTPMVAIKTSSSDPSPQMISPYDKPLMRPDGLGEALTYERPGGGMEEGDGDGRYSRPQSRSHPQYMSSTTAPSSYSTLQQHSHPDRSMPPPLTTHPPHTVDHPTRAYPLLSLPPPNGMPDPHHAPRLPLPIPLVLQSPLHPHHATNGQPLSHPPPPPHLLQHQAPLLPLPQSQHPHPHLPPPLSESHPHPHGIAMHPPAFDESSPPVHLNGLAGHGHGHTHGASSRPLIRPPEGVECCVMCGTRESPEWRRNETGIKDLCNAYVFFLSSCV